MRGKGVGGYAGIARVVQPHQVLLAPIIPIGLSARAGCSRIDQPGACCTLEQCNVAGVVEQFRVGLRMRKHQELNHELDVHDAACVVFEIELATAVGMAFEHAGAHRQNVGPQ